jgi:hypothetical protein
MSSLARVGALIAAGTLVSTGLVSGLSAPVAAISNDPVGLQSASSWIARQAGPQGVLQSGYEDNWTDPSNPTWVLYDDQGLTIDAIESLAEAGANPTAVHDMTDAVESEASDYASYGPGQKAKLLVLADIAGRDLDTFGGGGLTAGVEGSVSSAPESVGRLDNAYGSVLSQAYAARALTAAGSAEADNVVAYLLRQQCAEGYFRGDFSSGDDCVSGSTPNTDATAVAVLELSGHVAGSQIETAVAKARAWLKGRQLADGSWDAADPGVGNANATGLAARAIGASPEAERAAQWLWRHQASAGDSGTLAADAGAIAVDDTTYQDGRDLGLDERSRTFWVRATAQSLAVLRWLPALELATPSGYQRAGAGMAVTVTGTSAGDHLALSGPGSGQSTAVASDQWATSLVLPRGTAVRTYVVSDGRGRSASRQVAVLDATRLRVVAKAFRVARHHRVTVRVRGLAAWEQAIVRYRGHVVKRGVADAAGRFTARFAVGRSLGLKRVKALGQFRDIRRGHTVIEVVR